MARFKDCFLTPYLIGEGLSGFIPIVVAAIQGAGEDDQECLTLFNDTIRSPEDRKLHSNSKINTSFYQEPKEPPLFSPNVFFASLLVTLIISWLSFFWLLYSKTAALEKVTLGQDEDDEEEEEEIEAMTRAKLRAKDSIFVHRDHMIKRSHPSSALGDNDPDIVIPLKAEKITIDHTKPQLSRKNYVILQSIIIYACLMTFGLMPSIQPYSTLPYGNWSLHLTVLAVGLAYPLGCAIAMIRETNSFKWIYFWTLIATIISIVIWIFAILSPNPPLAHTDSLEIFGLFSFPMITIGGYLMIFCWTSFTLILSYVKTMITLIVTRSRGEEALFMVGLLTQVGSLFGALFMYLAVNHFKWFDDNCIHGHESWPLTNGTIVLLVNDTSSPEL